MDWLFGDNHSMDESLHSMDGNQSTSNESMDPLDSGFSTTTIEKSLDLSPIRTPIRTPVRRSTRNVDNSNESVYDFDEGLSFDKSKSNRNYFSGKKSLQFCPILGSTPKPSKSNTIRRTQLKRKKSYKNKRSDISLWDKAIVKNPELKQWINSFNDEMKIIESSELSVTTISISSDK